MQAYKDKSKLEDDKSVINGVRYRVNDLTKLPTDLAPYKAAQKEDKEKIVFHGELSPYSNFHTSHFVMNNVQFKSSEHWIRYQKP